MSSRLSGQGGKGRAGIRLTPAALPRTPVPLLLACLALLFTGLSCSSSRKMSRVRANALAATIQLPSEMQKAPSPDEVYDEPQRDTLVVTDMDGKEAVIMKAVKDDDGDMVATEQLRAAVVTARFRNVAERHGKVILEFQVCVPAQMQDARWQLRLHPDMFVLSDSIRLDDVVITGAGYRKAQLRGYELYEKFIRKIVEDSLRLVDRRDLEIFIQRNIPEVYAFRSDSSFVSEEEFSSRFGVTESRAVEHYTWKVLRWRNERLKSIRGKKWDQYVKAPIVTEGIRLDTVMRNADGDFVYNYLQTLNARPRMRKVDIVLSGEIFEQDKRLYSVPKSDPLTFYVSSLSSFADTAPRYLTRVISRSVEANTVSNIDFRVGRTDIDESLGDNRSEIGSTQNILRSLLVNESFEMDSIVIVASASPEGTLKSNLELTYGRATSASDYFSDYVEKLRDSIRREAGAFIDVGEDMSESSARAVSTREIDFLSRSGGENWPLLDILVERDSLLSQDEKEDYRSLSDIQDLDQREAAMRGRGYYSRLRDDLYPKLRTVRFSFHLHRKGMVKDTVHTEVLDSAYMSGVQALVDRDYETAVKALSPYGDVNCAIAYVALDRNLSAKSILERCRKTAKVNYLLAIVYSREGDDRDAVECYVRSCQQDPAYVSRGNLDPEITSLIMKYNLNEQPI